MDDEAKLARYTVELLAALDASIGGWIRRSIRGRSVELADSDAADRAVAEGAGALGDELRRLLSQDIDDQPEAPLQVLRRGVRFATQVLAEAGVEPVTRDEFATRAFPEDLYGLAPASFADVDPALHEPGLVWGAAKAHVHLRRRREGARAQVLKVIALSSDLMDRSKISAAFDGAVLVRSFQAVVDSAEPGSLVLVDLARVGHDLNRIGEVVARVQPAGRVIGFGSHVEHSTLAAAAEAGAEALARSVFFRRLADNSLTE